MKQNTRSKFSFYWLDGKPCQFFNFKNPNDVDNVATYYRCKIDCAESQNEFNGFHHRTDLDTFDYLVMNYELKY